MKIGDKYICIKEFRVLKYYIGKVYYITDISVYFVKFSNNDIEDDIISTIPRIMYIDSLPEYFITEKEHRKLKLDRIRQNVKI